MESRPDLDPPRWIHMVPGVAKSLLLQTAFKLGSFAHGVGLRGGGRVQMVRRCIPGILLELAFKLGGVPHGEVPVGKGVGVMVPVTWKSLLHFTPPLQETCRGPTHG